jgi:hypothetical protein
VDASAYTRITSSVPDGRMKDRPRGYFAALEKLVVQEVMIISNTHEIIQDPYICKFLYLCTAKVRVKHTVMTMGCICVHLGLVF